MKHTVKTLEKKKNNTKMADCTADKVSECKEKAEDILNSLGAYAGADQTKELQERLNAYNQAIQDAAEYTSASGNFTALLSKLDEEVEIEEK